MAVSGVPWPGNVALPSDLLHAIGHVAAIWAQMEFRIDGTIRHALDRPKAPKIKTTLAIPLCKWVLAFHLMAASKKGIAAHQLWRTLGFGSYRTAWFMAHRIREAMKVDVAGAGPIGGEGKVVEVDETYFGRRETPKPSPQRRGRPNLKKKPFDKRSVVALVERGGEVRSFHVENATEKDIRDVLVRNLDRKSALHTDESALYTETGKEFADHRTVKHSAHE